MPKIEKPPEVKQLESPGQPYSVGIKIGKHFHFSGIVAVSPDKKPNGTPGEQVVVVVERMIFLLGVVGLTPRDVFRATVLFAGDLSLYDHFNKVWMDAFKDVEIMPVRMAYAVARLPFGCAVELAFDAVDQSA